MANLRSTRTALPFVVIISQKDGARHDVRVRVARPKGPTLRGDHRRYSPILCVVRGKLDQPDLDLLTRWIELNRGVLIDYRNGVIEYGQDVMNAVEPIGAASPVPARSALREGVDNAECGRAEQYDE